VTSVARQGPFFSDSIIAMNLRRLFPLFVLAAFAGCEASRQDSAPAPPDEVAEATAPDKGPTYDVRLETTEGDVVVRVHEDWAPHGARRFRELVEEKYYDGAKVFRVVQGFVAQFGMAADPAVNAKWDKNTIPDDPVRRSNKRGTVTFATSGPDSRTAQIFINLADNPNLDGMGFSPFGEVVEGMDIVDKFYSGYGEAPQQPLIGERGNAYLEAEFPELDAIKTAHIVSENSQPADGVNAAAPDAAAEGTAEPVPETPANGPQ
jgi:peptidyl-prolyl cis-trans isomerase A (cyclophilin A)